MEPLQFKCPVCEQILLVKTKGNVVPINFTLKCKFCSAKFRFVPEVISGPNLTENQVFDILKDDEIEKETD